MTRTKIDKLKTNSPPKPEWSSGRLTVTTVYQELHLLNRVQVQGAAMEGEATSRVHQNRW